VQSKYPCFNDSKKGCVIFVAWKLTKLCLKVLNWKHFEEWVCCVVHGWSTQRRAGYSCWPASSSLQTVGSLFKTPRASQAWCVKKDWAQLQFHAWLGQFSNYQNDTHHFRILKVRRLRLHKCQVTQVSGRTYFTAPCFAFMGESGLYPSWDFGLDSLRTTTTRGQCYLKKFSVIYKFSY